jgi:hypothetical protein
LFNHLPYYCDVLNQLAVVDCFGLVYLIIDEFDEAQGCGVNHIPCSMQFQQARVISAGVPGVVLVFGVPLSKKITHISSVNGFISRPQLKHSRGISTPSSDSFIGIPLF